MTLQWPWNPLVIGSLFIAKCEIAPSAVQLFLSHSKVFSQRFVSYEYWFYYSSEKYILLLFFSLIPDVFSMILDAL